MMGMLDRKGMNKKAQEGGASAFTIVGWVLLAILLVIVILALSGFFNPILEKLNLFPGSGVAALVKACDSYVQVNSKTDYCNFREVKVDGNTEYANCADERVQKDMAGENKGEFTCDNIVSLRNEKCVDLTKSGKAGLKVNGDLCGYYSCEDDLGGTPKSKASDCPTEKPKALDKGFSVSVDNKICCVAV